MKNRAIVVSSPLACAALALAVWGCSTSTIAINKTAMADTSTIAIMEFEKGRHIPKKVATECEDSFRGHFINAGKSVVERSKLDSVLKEIKRSQTGLVENSKEIGRLSGADALLFGNVTEYREEVKDVHYNEYVKDKYNPKKTIKIEKIKKMKFFYFQVQIRVVSTANGETILTLKNSYPERSYDMTSSITLRSHMVSTLSQMGDDLKKAMKVDKK